MKTITVKDSTNGSLTLAPNNHPIGKQPTGSINYRIVNIPDNIPTHKAVSAATSSLLPSDRFEVDWSEIKDGGAVIKKNSNRQIGDRPKTMFTARIDSNLLDALKAQAKDQGVTQVQLLEEAIAQFLQQ